MAVHQSTLGHLSRGIALLAAAAVLTAATLPVTAYAQPAAQPSDPLARADELAEQAKALGRAERWQEALPLFREAYSLKQSYDIAGNLGLTEAALELWRDAAEHLAIAIRGFPSAGNPKHREHLKAQFDEARTHVTAVSVTVNVEGAAILVNGKEVGTAPLPGDIFVEPGQHTVDAQLAGYQGPPQTINATEGGSATASLTLTLAENGPGPDTASEPLPLWPVFVGAGVTAALLGVGTAFQVVGSGQESDAEKAEATVGWQYDPQVHGMYEDADTSYNVRTGLFIGAGAAAVATIVYVVLYATADSNGDVAIVPTASGLVGRF